MTAHNPMLTRDGGHVIVPWREDLAQLIPHAKTFEHMGEKLMLIPNGADECKVARNVGVHLPSPILTRFDWLGSTPWEVQRTTAAMLTESERAYLLSTMGTGKTRSVLYALVWLLMTGQIKRALVCAPLSTLTPVWENEAFQLLFKSKGIRVQVIYGSRDKRIRLLGGDYEIAVINHHGLPMLAPELVARAFDVVVIDELAVFRNRSTQLWRAANEVINQPSVKYAWGLTGAPTPTSPVDAWAQVRLLTPNRTTRTKGAFENMTMRQISQFKWVPRPEANQIVFDAMQPATRYTMEDIQELPPTVYTTRDVKLDPLAQSAYDQLYRKMRVITQAGDTITAVNEGVLQGKLLQVATGFIYTDRKTVYALPATGRLRALDETIAETDRKVIVFVPFIHALAGIAAHLRAKGHVVSVVYGATPRGQRDRIFTAFQTLPSPRFLVAHPGCMAHGLTLTAANTIIWYSPPMSLETYDQANARIVRPSQTSRTLICHLAGTQVERLTYTRLRTRTRMQGVLLEMFRNQTKT
jgi:SNF2 family DNA or RNA helicase